MQAQDVYQQHAVHQQGPDQICNSISSMQAVRTVISTGIASILYSRGLVPDKCVSNKPIGDGLDRSPAHPRVSGRPGTTNMQMRNLVKGSSLEADQIIQIRDGAFDALDKGFLRELTLAIYLDQADPTNIIESYTFGITYERSPETGNMLPVLNITERLKHVGLADDAEVTVKRHPTVRDVKNSVRNLIKHLVLSMDTFYALPRRCFVNFKLLYTDKTPENYEPQGFTAGDPSQGKYYLKTHSERERPEVMRFKTVDTGHHAITLSSVSISRYIPNIDETSRQAQPLLGFSERLQNEIQAHLSDSKTRTFAWTDEDFAKLHAEDQEEVAPHPAGEKSRTGSGMDVDVQPQHVAETVKHEDSVDARATPNWEGRPDPERRLASVADSTMDLDERVQPTQLLITQKDHDGSPDSTQAPVSAIIPLEMTSSSPEDLIADCLCGVTRASEGQVQCDTCNKWFHCWCMGFHENDRRLEEESYKCFECKLAKSPVLLARKDILMSARTGFSDLVLFRRTLQLVKLYKPANMTALKNMLYAPGNGYKTTWKRLENEGFVKNHGVGRRAAWAFTAKIDSHFFEYYFSPESDNALLPGFNRNTAAPGYANPSKKISTPKRKRQRSGGASSPAKRVKFSHVHGGIELRGGDML